MGSSDATGLGPRKANTRKGKNYGAKMFGVLWSVLMFISVPIMSLLNSS
jgi:hypothetical protein